MELSPRNRRLLSLAVPAILLLAALVLYGFDYTVNDDVAMVTILNGSYTGTPDAHAIFLKYPLSWVIAALYTLLPAVSWYRVVLLSIYVLATAFLLCQLLCRFPRHPALVSLLLAGSVALLWLTQMVRFTFSTCGAFVSGAVILSYALIPREEDLRPGKLLPLLGLFWLSYCIRDYFALAGLLFLGIIWLCKYHDRLLRERRCWLIPLAGLLGLGLCVGVNTLAYSDPEWQDFLTYNEERSYVQDYSGIPSYSDNQELYDALGLTSAERDTISRYRYLLTSSFGPESFHVIYEYVLVHEEASEPLAQTVLSTFKDTVRHYLLCSSETVGPLQVASIALPVLLLAAALWFSIRDRRHWWVFPLLILSGLACMWLYICYQGRYPPRVALSLRILTVTASAAGLALLLIQRPARLPGQLLARRGASVAAVLAALALLGAGLGVTWLRAGREAAYQRASFYAYADEHPENVYLRDTQLTMFGSEEHPSLNTLNTGSWLHFSPLYEQKLELLGLEEVNRDTLLEPNVYLITAAGESRLRTVLGLGEDIPIQYEITEQLGSVYVYKIQSIG